MVARLYNPDIRMRMLSMNDLPFVSKKEKVKIQPEMDFSSWVSKIGVLESGVTLETMYVGKLVGFHAMMVMLRRTKIEKVL